MILQAWEPIYPNRKPCIIISWYVLVGCCLIHNFPLWLNLSTHGAELTWIRSFLMYLQAVFWRKTAPTHFCLLRMSLSLEASVGTLMLREGRCWPISSLSCQAQPIPVQEELMAFVPPMTSMWDPGEDVLSLLLISFCGTWDLCECGKRSEVSESHAC